MLTFIDGEPLKAGLLLRGSTVVTLGSLNLTSYIGLELNILWTEYLMNQTSDLIRILQGVFL